MRLRTTPYCRDSKREWDSEIYTRAHGPTPRCVFGLQLDDPGSIWSLTAEGVDPMSHTPGPEHGEFSRYGFTLRLAGDHDGDGVPDLLVSAKDGSAVKRLALSGGFCSVGHTLDVGADWDGGGARDICFSSWVPTAGGLDITQAIGVLSVEEGRFLHYVVASDLEELIWRRERS